MNRVLATTPLLLTLLASPAVINAQSADTISGVLNSLGVSQADGNGLANQGTDKLVQLLIDAGVDPLEIIASIAQFGDQQNLVDTVSELVSSGVSVGEIVSAAIAASPSAAAGDIVSAAIAQVADSTENVNAVVTAALNNGVQATDIVSAVIIGNSGLADSTSAIEAAISTLVAADVGNAANIVEAAVVAVAYVATSTDGELSMSQLAVAKDSGQLENVTVNVQGIDEIVAGAIYGAESTSASDRDLSDTDRVLLTDDTDSVVEGVVGEIIASVKDVSNAVFDSSISDAVVTEAANGVFTRISFAEGAEDNTVLSNVVATAAGNDENLRGELVADVAQTQPAAVVQQVASTSPTNTGGETTDTDAALVQVAGDQADTGGEVQQGTAVVTGQSPAAIPPPASNTISSPGGGGGGTPASSS